MNQTLEEARQIAIDAIKRGLLLCMDRDGKFVITYDLTVSGIILGSRTDELANQLFEKNKKTFIETEHNNCVSYTEIECALYNWYNDSTGVQELLKELENEGYIDYSDYEACSGNILLGILVRGSKPETLKEVQELLEKKIVKKQVNYHEKQAQILLTTLRKMREDYGN